MLSLSSACWDEKKKREMAGELFTQGQTALLAVLHGIFMAV
jgi:hypothetical protein